MIMFFKTLRLTIKYPRMARGMWFAWYWMGRAARRGEAYLNASSGLVYR